MNILVIRLGAFGDLVQCCWAFDALRRHHAQDRITLLTATKFAPFAQKMPFFDAVQGDSRPKLWKLNEWLRLRDMLNEGAFDLVYDLQRKPRTGWYYRLFRAKPRWIGAPPAMADLKGHNAERYLEMVKSAGVPVMSAPSWDWLDGDLMAFDLPERFALMIPGSSAHLPHKRWPAERYAALTERLWESRQLKSLLIGTDADLGVTAAIRDLSAHAIDLTGRTDYGQVAALARKAATVVGNDTGPTFLAAAVGAPTLMLMSFHTDPARAAPYGPQTAWLKRQDLTGLDGADVEAALLWR